MNANLNTVEKLLRRQRRWNQYGWALIAAVVGLAATLVFEWRLHPSFARVEKWGHLPRWWLGGLAITLIVAAVIYFFRRKSALQAAQIMDARWQAKNRLETADALSFAPDAIARAQHEETTGFIQQSQLRPRGIPLSWLVNLVTLLFLAHLFLLASWTRPLSSSLFAGKKNDNPAENSSAGNFGNANSSAAEQANAKAAAAAAKSKAGSIVWNTPEEEIKAAAVEEVPLEAVADSTTGFHDMVLKISVNGESRPPVPVEMADLKNAGRHTIKTSLYMDKLGVKPYDIVSYDLHAQRNGDQPSEASSPMQFVQIKPLRANTPTNPPPPAAQKRNEPPGAPAKAAFDYITAIKVAQLQAMKENYALAHSELSHDSEDWKDENEQAATNQNSLAEKTGEAISLLTSNGVPEQITGLLQQARPEMADAAKKISATENEPALSPQGKALALITQVEQFLRKSPSPPPSPSSGPPPPDQQVNDPFNKNELALKPRDQTPAGELETLAKEQSRLADDIATTNTAAEKPDAGKITGTPAEREAQISQRITALLATNNFAPEIAKHLDQGRSQAQASLKNLNAEYLAAAGEPAAEAARELAQAAGAMQQSAEQAAKDELADALRTLSDAAGAARATPAQPSPAAAQQQAANVASQVQNAARTLAQAAQQQQETGSSKAATQLNELAKALAAGDLQKALQQLHEQPRSPAAAQKAANKLQDLADRAGLMRNNGQLPPAELVRLADRLERAHANIQRLIAQNSAAKSPNNTAANPANNSPNNPSANPPISSPENPPNNPSSSNNSSSPSSPPSSSPNNPPSGSPSASPASTPNTPPSSSAANTPNSPNQGSPNNPPNNSSSPNMAASTLPIQTTSLSPTFANGGAQGSFGGEVISNVREALLEAVPALPKSPELAALRGELRNAPEPDAPDIDMTAFMQKIDPQLEGVIKLLREQSQGEQRPFKLTEEQVAQAPAAYRPAVADYFEKLSRDYPADSKAPAK